MKLLLVYALLINIAGFMQMGADKSRARGKRWRVPERRLFLLAAWGGALGVWLGMQTFRHKTQHPSFVWGVPALLALNLVCAYAIIRFLL